MDKREVTDTLDIIMVVLIGLLVMIPLSIIWYVTIFRRILKECFRSLKRRYYTRMR